MTYYHTKNASKPFKVGLRYYSFIRYRQVGYDWFGVYATDDAAVIAALAPLVADAETTTVELITLDAFTAALAELAGIGSPVGGGDMILTGIRTQLGGFYLDGSTFTSVTLPLVVTIVSNIGLTGCTSLQSIAFPVLVSVGQAVACYNSPLLSEVSFPLWLPTNGKDINFFNCALSQASVDHILARCVASAGYVSGTVDLSGGTTYPPSSVAPGSDYDILIQRGVTVNS